MRAGDRAFLNLADALRPGQTAQIATTATIAAAASSQDPALPGPAEERDGSYGGHRAPGTDLQRPARSTEEATAIRAARLFHAALGDAYDAIAADLIREIAVEIVARELRLADVDLARIARRLIAERQAEDPVRLRVAPQDAGILCELPVVVDPALEAGDAILECRSGSIDARLGVRLSAVLDAVIG